eukprot:scaffold2544_cov245-Pinguiococcus_pyrenoidosus.AAC.9
MSHVWADLGLRAGGLRLHVPPGGVSRGAQADAAAAASLLGPHSASLSLVPAPQVWQTRQAENARAGGQGVPLCGECPGGVDKHFAFRPFALQNAREGEHDARYQSQVSSRASQSLWRMRLAQRARNAERDLLVIKHAHQILLSKALGAEDVPLTAGERIATSAVNACRFTRQVLCSIRRGQVPRRGAAAKEGVLVPKHGGDQDAVLRLPTAGGPNWVGCLHRNPFPGITEVG